VQRAHDLRRAPSLVEADIAGDIRHEQAGIVPRTVGRTARGEDWKERAESHDHPGGRRGIEILDRPAVDRTVIKTEARREAAAELGGVGEWVNAETAEILISEIGLEAITRGVEEIETRDCLADSEAGVLDEGADKVDVIVAVRRRSRSGAAAGRRDGCAGETERRGVNKSQRRKGYTL
jgi:hypothetical protein